MVIFDPNVETIRRSEDWTKPGPPDSENDLELKQRSLLSFLRNKRSVNMTQVWFGGEGNTERGLCFPLTYDWCVRVIEAQGLPSTEHELLDLGYYHLTGKAGARGKAPKERKPYVKKGEGGDGRGKKLAEQAGPSRYGLRSKG